MMVTNNSGLTAFHVAVLKKEFSLRVPGWLSLALGFDSGHDLAIMGASPGGALHPWDSFSRPLSLPLPRMHALFLSLKINKYIVKKFSF